MVIFQPTPWIVGQQLSEADMYNLNVIIQANKVSCPYPSNCVYFHLEILIFIHTLHPGFTKGSNTVFGGPKYQHPKRSQLELEFDWILSMHSASQSMLYINSLYCYRKKKKKAPNQPNKPHKD